jgi:hypothetical protein
MVAAIESARAAGAHGMRLACHPKNTIARSLCESLGFADQGTINADGEHDLRLDFSPDQ